MVYLNRITLFICIISALHLGLEGIFEVDLFQKALISFPVITHLFKITALFAGAYQILNLSSLE